MEPAALLAPTRVAIPSDGFRLAGDLRVPAGSGPHPAVVLTGPFTGVKEQVTGLYAERLARRGYATLAFDHRRFGGSDGEPRQHEDAAGRLADLRDALTWLRARPEVDADRVGCVGVCLGGGYALRFAARDPRVRALATVAGGYNEPAAMRAGMGAEGYRGMLAGLVEGVARQHGGGEPEYVAAVADGDGEALMSGDEPFAYYGTERAASPGWVDRVTRASLYELLTVDLGGASEVISPTPWLVVHGRVDAYCSPVGAESVHARAGGPKRLVWLDTTNHIDLYDREPYVSQAVDEVVTWFDEHLR